MKIINHNFIKALQWINDNKIAISKRIKNRSFDMFDYPEYWGMPKSISNKLISDEVDFIQSNTWDFVNKFGGENDHE